MRNLLLLLMLIPALVFADIESGVIMPDGGGGTDLTATQTDNAITRGNGTDEVQDSDVTLEDISSGVVRAHATDYDAADSTNGYTYWLQGGNLLNGGTTGSGGTVLITPGYSPYSYGVVQLRQMNGSATAVTSTGIDFRTLTSGNHGFLSTKTTAGPVYCVGNSTSKCISNDATAITIDNGTPKLYVYSNSVQIVDDLIGASSMAFGAYDATTLSPWGTAYLGTGGLFVGVNSGAIAAAGYSSDAIAHIKSTTKGVIFADMTSAQAEAISTPDQGLMMYDTDLDKYRVSDGTELRGITMEDPFQCTATITSAAAATPVSCLAATAVPSDKQVFINVIRAKVNGATPWATTAACVIEDTNGADFVSVPVSEMTANAFITDANANLTLSDSYALDAGGTADHGVQIVCDANGTGSDFVVTVSGFIK